MKTISFTKMHALGNDFVIINNIQQNINVQQLPIIKLSHRHTGIGFDQLLIIENSQRANFFCRIFNADGSEAEQCGNGLRCIARFIQEERLHTQSTLSLETIAGIFALEIKDFNQIRVTMGKPVIQEKLIELDLQDGVNKIPLSILSLGNPHAILKVDSLETISTSKLGSQISNHTYFPNGVNVGFMQIINQHALRLCTFERGVGETYACGSNACAAVVAGIANGWLNQTVQVELTCGTLLIDWNGLDTPVYMSGPASRVFSGELSI